MDIETAEALDALRIDLRRVESTLSTRIDRSEAALRGEMRALQAELRLEMVQLRAEVREDLAENRRHSQVLNESVRDDIRIVAEAVAALTAKVDALSPR